MIEMCKVKKLCLMVKLGPNKSNGRTGRDSSIQVDLWVQVHTGVTVRLF